MNCNRPSNYDEEPVINGIIYFFLNYILSIKLLLITNSLFLKLFDYIRDDNNDDNDDDVDIDGTRSG